MWKPCVVFICLVVSAAANSNTVVILSYSHGVIEWENVYTTGVYHVEWASELPGAWTDSWNALRNIPTTGNLIQASVPTFYRVLYVPPQPMFEDFEDDGGWSDHLPGAKWTEEADTGTWSTGVPTYPTDPFFARTDAANAYSGERYVGVETNIPGVLRFPPVNNPDQISCWMKGIQKAPRGGFGGTVTFEYGVDDPPFGMLWLEFHQTNVSSLAYVEVTANPNWRQDGQDPPIANVRLKLEPDSGAALYVDDVTVAPWEN